MLSTCSKAKQTATLWIYYAESQDMDMIASLLQMPDKEFEFYIDKESNTINLSVSGNPIETLLKKTMPTQAKKAHEETRKPKANNNNNPPSKDLEDLSTLGKEETDRKQGARHQL